MNKIFLDTVGIIAILDEADQWHAPAEEAYDLMRRDNPKVMTTRYVLLECGNAASRRPYRHEILHLKEQLESEGGLITPDQSDWIRAWQAYGEAPIGGASIVDCISFETMRRLGIRRAFTNDGHFEQAGFEVLF